MTRGRDGGVRILCLFAALSLGAVACGAAESDLPAATAVTFSSMPQLPTLDVSTSSDAVSTTLPLELPTSSTPAASTTTVEGVPESIPASGDWVNATEGLVGLTSECGNMSLVISRPDQDMMIAGIARQGLWASTEGVDTWSKLGSHAGSARIQNRPTIIIFDPESPDTFWESGIYNMGGVYRTDDGGATFRQLGNATHVEGVSVDLTDPNRNTLLITIHESNHAFRSTDGGETWFDLTSFLPTDIGWVSTPLVIDDHTFLLGTYHGDESAVLRSTDAGETWTIAYDAGVVGNPLRANADGALYWLLERINGIIVSYDDGLSWEVIPSQTEILPTFGMILELFDGSLASIWNDNVVVSMDQGASWTTVGPPIPSTPFGIAYSPFRRAFYAWHAGCDFTTENPILVDSIMRLDFDPTAL